ncbi:hypothetical protein KEM48_006939 [Puccinia striiformis f. sp. tritici PST-130]|nr:hypothetical protein H4Q26_006918 [Puccinia striiformis f. sp. tritici PST-130]KAI9618000.1 hypothetical protein KEM48_006939 [Puccinia striiformis f. sp. tritici PST-130]
MNTYHIYLFLSLALYPGAFSLLTGFDPKNLPYKSDGAAGQTGYNRCGTKATKDSQCQNLFINSAEDFCVFAPPTVLSIGEAERIAVSYCSKNGHGTRLIPPGTFRTMHYVRTQHYIQITALGDFTKINVPAGDEGGELVLTVTVTPSVDWSLASEANSTNGPNSLLTMSCPSEHASIPTKLTGTANTFGSRWNMPGNYDGAGFDQCEGDDVPHPMGEYRRPDGSIYTWQRGHGPQPPAGQPGKIKSCKSVRAPGLNYPRSAKRNSIS